jgi:hypothetical protein
VIFDWCASLPGLDWRYAPQDEGDAEFADRMAALACALRVTGTDPSATKLPRSFVNLVDGLLDWIQEAETDLDSYIRRLALAMTCSAPRLEPHTRQITADAERYRKYLTDPRGKRGGWI